MTKIDFLGMTIQDSGNNDGVTLVANRCSVANFGKDWESAKIYAIRWFMIMRPNIFGHALSYRLAGREGSYREFGLLERACKDEGIEIPEEVMPSSDINRMITFKGVAV